MSLEKIYYRGAEQMRDFYNIDHKQVIFARNRLHRWWLRRRNPGATVWLKKEVRMGIDFGFADKSTTMITDGREYREL